MKQTNKSLFPNTACIAPGDNVIACQCHCQVTKTQKRESSLLLHLDSLKQLYTVIFKGILKEGTYLAGIFKEGTLPQVGFAIL